MLTLVVFEVVLHHYGHCFSKSISIAQANKILKKKIEDDQFLDLMTVKTEVRSACKEPYR